MHFSDCLYETWSYPPINNSHLKIAITTPQVMPRQHVFCSFMVCNFYMGFSSGSSRRRREQRRPSESRPTSCAAPCLMYLQFCDRGSPASGGRRGCGPAAPPNRFSPCGGRRVIQNCLGRHKHWI